MVFMPFQKLIRFVQVMRSQANSSTVNIPKVRERAALLAPHCLVTNVVMFRSHGWHFWLLLLLQAKVTRLANEVGVEMGLVLLDKNK